MTIQFLSKVDFTALTACFNEAFSDYFVIHETQAIPDSERFLYLMERK